MTYICRTKNLPVSTYWYTSEAHLNYSTVINYTHNCQSMSCPAAVEETDQRLDLLSDHN